MPKTVWKKLESWRPSPTLGACPILDAAELCLVSREATPGCFIHKKDRRGDVKFYKTYAAALAAANKQNRLEGLPEVQ